MKKIIIALAIFLSLSINAIAQDITLRDTVWLRKATHVNYDLVSWDTVFVVIVHGVERDTVFLSSNGKGRWDGFYVPSYSGNFVAEYNAVYTGGDTTVEEQYFAVLDTTAFHGAAAGLTAQQIWEYATRTLTSYGEGTGTEKETLVVLDEDTNTVEGVSITVFNTSGTPVAFGETDVNGKEVLSLDVATYTFALQRIGVIYNDDTTLTITADGTDTIWVVSYDPGAPPSASLTRIEGWNRDLGYGKRDRLKVSFRPQYSNLIDTAQGVFVTIKEVVVYTDTGYFSINLIPSVHLISKQPEGDIDSILYDMDIKRGYIKEAEYRNIFVPDTSGTVNLKDILD